MEGVSESVTLSPSPGPPRDFLCSVLISFFSTIYVISYHCIRYHYLGVSLFHCKKPIHDA